MPSCITGTSSGFAALDDVRRRVQQQTTGHRGLRDDPLYRIRRVLRRGAERLTDRAWERLLTGTEAGDNASGDVARTWITAQGLPRHDRAYAARRLDAVLTDAVFSGIPELTRLAKTVATRRTELLANFDTGGASNGTTEGLNRLNKKIKRVGHGFRNFDNHRLGLLLHRGITWNSPNDLDQRPATTLGCVDPIPRSSGRRPATAATRCRISC